MKWRSNDALKEILVSPEDTLLDSLPKMDKAALQVLLVVNEKGQLMGIVTDGDVRRAILNGMTLKTPVSTIMHAKPRSLPVNIPLAKARKFMEQQGIKHIPLVDSQGRVKDLVILSDCFGTVSDKRKEKVIIMAGGKGTRLDPFTKILPKPMIPLGDKPIIEVIMDKFYQQGFTEFILSLGYKAEIVKMYFSETNNRPYKLEYVYENQPLGTAGALSILKDQLKETFLVINCDVIIEPNYFDLMEQHYKLKNDITIVGSVKEFPIPYGVLKTEGQNLLTVDEKPNFHFLVNTGLYVIEPSVIDLVRENEFVNMTDLVLTVKDNGGKVGVYPYHGSWFDIGQWEDYRNSLRYMGVVE